VTARFLYNCVLDEAASSNASTQTLKYSTEHITFHHKVYTAFPVCLFLIRHYQNFSVSDKKTSLKHYFREGEDIISRENMLQKNQKIDGSNRLETLKNTNDIH
jgi:hypothetical protein